MYMIFEELENNVVDWGIRKGILGDLELDSEIDTRKKKQLLKFEEEAGEMVEAVLVTLTIQANLWGLSLTECLDEAYNKINVRTGHMIDGVFVKDE